jgi:hypothetical protein
MPDFTRRAFLSLTPPALSLQPFSGSRVLEFSNSLSGASPPSRGFFPFQDRDLVREIVAASHGNLARVKELVTARPALARASWDWGFGDHEAAIDAASHMGNRPIAEFLIANGARPTIFTMAMLGRVEVVRAIVDALPGVQRTRGPHGITLLAHARAGGAPAADMVSYLERLGDADPRYPHLPLSDAEQAALTGDYAVENATVERLRIGRNARGDFSISAPDVMIDRALFHQGGFVFNPAGAEAVKIRFQLEGDRVVSLTVEDGATIVTARRLG